MKRIGNFIYEHRITNVIERHAPMILKSATVGLLLMIVWNFMQKAGDYLEKSDLPMTTVLPLLGIFYALFASNILGSTNDKYREVSYSVVRKDKAKFLQLRDEKISIMWHVFLGSLAIMIQLFVMLIKYENVATGRLCVFSLGFFFTLTAIVALELDDPIRSVWFQKKIDPDWLTANVDEFFEEELHKKSQHN
jgi:hypothetical protein